MIRHAIIKTAGAMALVRCLYIIIVLVSNVALVRDYVDFGLPME